MEESVSVLMLQGHRPFNDNYRDEFPFGTVDAHLNFSRSITPTPAADRRQYLGQASIGRTQNDTTLSIP